MNSSARQIVGAAEEHGLEVVPGSKHLKVIDPATSQVVAILSRRGHERGCGHKKIISQIRRYARAR